MHEHFLDNSTETIESEFKGKWFLKEDEAKKFFKQIDDSIGRYPHGWRHMENYVNYKAINKEATMEEYTAEMNRQVEFEEFLSILRTATVEEANSPMFRH